MKIFSFPHLVIDEIIKECKPIELVCLSFCSKRAHAVVKNFAKIKDVEVEKRHGYYYPYGLCFSGQRPNMIWADSENGFNLNTSELAARRGFKLLIDEDRDLCTYWTDVEQGCQEVINYVCDLFKVSVSTVSLVGEDNSRLLDFIQKRQEQKLKTVEVSKPFASFDFRISAEEYSTIMRCNATERLQVRLKPPRDYRFDGNLPPVKNLIISDGFWITREHLLSLQSQHVSIGIYGLTTLDVNVLLRSWLNGGFPNLKYLYLGVSEVQFEDDIRDRMEPVQGEISYYWLDRDYNMYPVEFRPRLSFHIRREDNVVATVKLDRNYFTMVVWPDMNGKRVF